MVLAVLLGANWLRYQCGFADTIDTLDANNNNCRDVVQSKRIIRTRGKDARPLEAEVGVFWARVLTMR